MIDPTFTLTFTDGLIIGAITAYWMWSEYRQAQADAEIRASQADHTTSPRVVGHTFYMDSIFNEEDAWPTR